ncbi:PREDICTED: uncharacterized protein LOC100636250 [Amphimedon queenslandica]|uniref:Death domain-containing protein n=1 Tax=Amphimedon queenslandica TaxID=400682 RepID=A0A1X7U9Z7_AMPQE|nr:PREDICTED: uncharacterized protein LOC100636250 [Amphimedon queenslandica]|eukprot:XP_003388635.1 PREDICTED: uncharacterized protein LOC100636250 [Amphimedon queenslandica]
MALPPSLRSTGYYKGHPIDLNDPICLSLPRDIIWPLCLHLSNEQALIMDSGGGDWRTLADFIGLPLRIIEMIEDYRGDKTKAFTLFKLWDRGIPVNPGSLLKLIVALHKSGFRDSYLRDFIVSPLQGCIPFQDIKDYIDRLSPDEMCQMFPRLTVNDIHWDEDLEATVVTLSDEVGSTGGRRSPTGKRDLYLPQSASARIIKDSIFISHYYESRSKDYKREVENIAKIFKHRGHCVWFGPTITGPERDHCIRSAETILVVFNVEYQQAERNFYRKDQCSCVSPDILSINNLFYNVTGGRQRIIPVLIDKCPRVNDLPVWLTSVPKVHYPSQTKALVHIVQGVKEYETPKITEVRRVKPKVIDKDAVMRRFEKNKRS